MNPNLSILTDRFFSVVQLKADTSFFESFLRKLTWSSLQRNEKDETQALQTRD
jgi:hypothetical protein